MAKFCGKCGSRLNETFKLCPNCDADQIKTQRDLLTAANTVETKTEESPTSPDVTVVKQAEPVKPTETPTVKAPEQVSIPEIRPVQPAVPVQTVRTSPAEKMSVTTAAVNTNVTAPKPEQPLTKKERKAAKKAAKKAEKKALPIGKKIQNFIVKLFIILVLLIIAFVSAVVILLHFGMIDNTSITNLLHRTGINLPFSIDGDSFDDNSVSSEDTVNNDTDSNADYDSQLSDSYQGTPVDFEDTQMKRCVENALGLMLDQEITDQMCETVTEITCDNHHISTLADLAMFPNLTKLYVDNGGETLDLKGINKAPKLTSVTLKNCDLSEIDRIADLTHLEYLDISTSSFYRPNIKDYSSLAALTNLKYLDMSWTKSAYNSFRLVDASFINSLTNLEELNLYETGIKNYSLASLGKLKKLTISECDVDEVLKQLVESGSIHSLESLCVCISYSKSLTNAGIKEYLSQATNLKDLQIYYINSDVTSLDGLGNLTALETLYLDNRYAFDLPLSAYNELTKLTNLTELILTNAPSASKHSADDYAFLNDMKSLRALYIGTYDGMAIECFSGLDQLEYLYLVSTFAFTSEPLEVDITGIEKFTALKELGYHSVRFKSSAPLDDLDYLTVTELTMADLR